MPGEKQKNSGAVASTSIERVMVIDDDPGTRKALRRILSREGYEVRTAGGGPEAVALLTRELFHLVIVDLLMEPVDGLEVLSRVKKIDPDTEVILMTGHGSVDAAVEAIKRGAFHYVEKPLRPNMVRHLAGQALEKRRLKGRIRRLERENRAGSAQIVGKSPAILKIKRLIRQVAVSDANVLIMGESGTGKELEARAIHQASRRSARGFFPVNCAAYTEDLLANELFGHEKEAYTGATTARPGILEHAHGGTIFFDEVGDMPLAMQSKLLRVIQERELVRVGGVKPVHIDIRIVAATNKDLKKAMRLGTFREDLFYRLNVVPLTLPSLKERKEDIALLADYFLGCLNSRNRHEILGFSREAMAVLRSYNYPGNIRELENIVERAVALSTGEIIGVDDLPEDLREIEVFTISRDPGCMKSLSEMELEYIQWVLEQCGHNKSRAADLLGINRVSLYRKLKKSQISE
jgi:DNA-binding NtrC family response regulator